MRNHRRSHFGLLVVLVIAACLAGQVAAVAPVQAGAGSEQAAGSALETRSAGSLTLDQAPLAAIEPGQAGPPAPTRDRGWNVLMTEGFEGAWPTGLWNAYDANGATGGTLYWDDDLYMAHTGRWSAWPGRGGADGVDPEYSYYRNNMQSYMVYGPFDLSGYSAANFDFWYWNQSQAGYDHLWYLASHNGTDFVGGFISGDSLGWHHDYLDLAAYLGDSSVWIAFAFITDGSGVDDGPWVDDITLKALTGAAVPNDDIWSVTDIAGAPFTATQDVSNATTALDDPLFTCYGGQGNKTVWYRYTAPSAQTLIIDTFGSDYNTVLEVWAPGVLWMYSVACSDDAPSSIQSRVEFAATAGTTYLIEIAASSGPNSQLTLNLASASPPGAFGKTAPVNGAAGVSLSPALSWNGSAGAASYDYCVDTTNDGVCGSTWVNTGTGTSANPGGLADNTPYYWQVRANNAFGATDADGGTWWGFTTVGTGPGAFGKTAPVNGAAGVSLSPALSWNGSAGAASYDYCVDTTNDGVCGSTWVNTGTGTSANPGGLADNTPYYWQVRANNAFGATDADGGTWWQFTTGGPVPVSANFKSMAANDGWVLEQDEISGKGGPLDSIATTGRLGDDNLDRQYRSILHFDTSALPDNAVVVGVTLYIKRQAIAGANPFTTHGFLKVDAKSGAYHNNPALERLDFHAVGSRGNVGRFIKTPADGWYRAPLRARSYGLINLTGSTQFRLRFATDDNDDAGADYLSFYTGNTPTIGDRPELIVTYYVP